jgi:predicted O-methyltransferase YrrM
MNEAPEFQFDFFSHNTASLSGILDNFKGKPVSCLEIGSFEGRSTLWFLENILTHEASRITCVDTFAGSVEHLELGMETGYLEDAFRRNTYAHRSKISIHKGKSGEVLRKLEGVFDFIYIDGSHDKKDVLTDSIHSFRLAEVGSIIVWDDYAYWDPIHDLRPALAIDSFLNVYQGQYDLLNRGWQLAIMKKGGYR